MLFGIEKKVKWMDLYLIYKITILPFKKLERNIKIESIFVLAPLIFSPSIVIRPNWEDWFLWAQREKLSLLSPLSLHFSLQPNKGFALPPFSSPSNPLPPSIFPSYQTQC